MFQVHSFWISFSDFILEVMGNSVRVHTFTFILTLLIDGLLHQMNDLLISVEWLGLVRGTGVDR
jgi:uncharacterized RDD family membrane protein YckC